MKQEDSVKPSDVKYGIYEHYKGGRYLVLGVARDHCTDGYLVVYIRLHGRKGVPMSVQPADRFLGYATLDGERVRRFRHVGLTEPEAG